jgi:hypothetical protein
MDLFLWPLHTFLWYSWCWWRHHAGLPLRQMAFTKGKKSLTYRVCLGCNRVYQGDTERVLNIITADLNEEPPA